MTTITYIAIVGREILVYRGRKCRTYHSDRFREAAIRRAVICGYLYHGLLKWDIESYRIEGRRPAWKSAHDQEQEYSRR